MINIEGRIFNESQIISIVPDKNDKLIIVTTTEKVPVGGSVFHTIYENKRYVIESSKPASSVIKWLRVS